MNEFIVGSIAFFDCYDDFNPHDCDTLILKNEFIDGVDVTCQVRINNNCYFEWKRLSPDEFVEYHKDKLLGMLLGKFLVKEFVDEIGFTIDHLKQLKGLSERLDDKHLYEKVIYDAYIENGDFYLTDEQRLKAYEEYKKYR